MGRSPVNDEERKALEDWIVAIVRDEMPGSDGSDFLRRCAAKDVVVRAFARAGYGDMTKEDYEAIYGWGGQG